jgi:phosphatidylglycerophosphate synthase
MASAFARVRTLSGRTADDPIVGALAVAALTAGLGGLLAHQTEWRGAHVLAGWLAYALLGGIVLALASLRLGRARFGLPNQITLLRAGLVCLVAGALLASGHPPSMSWSLAGLIAATLALDGVDGWLARRLGLASAFGARFDVEVDALLLLILALLVWQAQQVAAWVLAIGLLRYGFVLAGRILPWLSAPLPQSRRREAICVQQGITLLVCLLPPTPPALASIAAAIALAALILSFALDIYWLQRGHCAVRRHWFGRQSETTSTMLPEQA